MRKPKVFLLYPYYWPLYKAGGPVQSLYNMVSLFKDQLEFYLVSNNTDTDGSEPEQKLKLNSWTVGDGGENIYYVPSITPWLIYRIILNVKPDLVMVNGLFNVSTTLPGLLFGKLLKCKIILSPRGMLQEWGLKRSRIKKRIFIGLLKIILKKNETWHATDLQENVDILKIFGPYQLVNVASNIPRKLEKYRPLSFPVMDRKIKIVFLSLINSNKNLHLVIDGIKRFSKKFELDIYGPVSDGTYWELCQNKMRGTQSVNYYGAIPPWEVSGILSQYHFFILPTMGENFGHAIFDSLASSVPVIISKFTPWDQIDTKSAGFYVDIEYENSFDIIFEKLLSMSSQEYDRYRQSAYNYAKAYLESKDYLNEYDFLFATMRSHRTSPS